MLYLLQNSYGLFHWSAPFFLVSCISISLTYFVFHYLYSLTYFWLVCRTRCTMTPGGCGNTCVSPGCRRCSCWPRTSCHRTTCTCYTRVPDTWEGGRRWRRGTRMCRTTRELMLTKTWLACLWEWGCKIMLIENSKNSMEICQMCIT